jgi:hypothetical protein
MFGAIKRVIQFWLIGKFGTPERLRDFLVSLPERERVIYAKAIAKRMPSPDDLLLLLALREAETRFINRGPTEIRPFRDP